MQLRKAEMELGLVLFDREKQPIVPTPAGIALIEQARTVLREHAKLNDMGRSAAHAVRGEFRLGIIPTLAPYLVPRFAPDFVRSFPEVQLTIDELKTDEIIEALRTDALDAGMLATPLHVHGLHERVIFYEPFYLYVNAASPLADRKRVSEKDLDGSQIWLLKDGHCFRDQVINYCSLDQGQHSAMPGLRFTGSNFETLRNLIRAGTGYTLFPYLFIASLPVAEREKWVKPFTAPIPSREVSLVHRRDQWKVRILDALQTTLARVLPQELRSQERTRLEVIAIAT